MEKYLSRYLYVFRKSNSTQRALIKLLQSCQCELDKSGFVGTILMDISKACNCLSYVFLIAKLEAYGVSKEALCLMESFSSNSSTAHKSGFLI